MIINKIKFAHPFINKWKQWDHRESSPFSGGWQVVCPRWLLRMSCCSQHPPTAVAKSVPQPLEVRWRTSPKLRYRGPLKIPPFILKEMRTNDLHCQLRADSACTSKAVTLHAMWKGNCFGTLFPASKRAPWDAKSSRGLSGHQNPLRGFSTWAALSKLHRKKEVKSITTFRTTF